MIFKDGQATENIKGADAQKLQRVVADLANIASSSAAAAGSTSGSGAASGWRSAPLPRGYEDVTDQIDVKGLEIMNADDGFGTVRTLIESSKPSALDAKGKEAENGAKDWVESDTDEQLMLFMPFQAMLKIHTLQVSLQHPISRVQADDRSDYITSANHRRRCSHATKDHFHLHQPPSHNRLRRSRRHSGHTNSRNQGI